MAKQSTPPISETKADEGVRAPSPAPEPTPLPKPVPGVRPISLKEARSTAKR